MKLERNGIVVIIFIVTFVILLLFSFLTSGYRLDIKGFFVAIYFAIWIDAVAYVILTFVLPYLSERKKAKKKTKSGFSPAPGVTPAPFRSPRSNLPLRERIAAYVAERRREDGLSAPEPLLPSRPVPSATAAPADTASRRSVTASIPEISAPAAVSFAFTGGGTVSAGDEMGDLPLPDDFGSIDDSSRGMESLPGLDDDGGDLGGFGDEDEMLTDFGEEESVLSTQSGLDLPETVSPSSFAMPGGELPDFDGTIEPDVAESDLIPDDGMMDLSGDDVLMIDDDIDVSPSSPEPGGISEDGLPDLDDTLEPDIQDSDLSGDEDFDDIELMDLEPEEPEKSSK
jgi:uncharacterized membrane protein